MCESRSLRNRPVHCNRSWIVCAGVRTAASPSPVDEVITRSRRGRDGDTSPAISPSTGRTHPATSPVAHSQVILGAEYGCVGRIGSRRDSMRDRAIVAPPGP